MSPYRRVLIDGLLAGHPLKGIAHSLDKKPKTVAETYAAMARETGNPTKGISGLIINIVLSHPDPTQFVRDRRDPNGYMLSFNEERIKKGLLTKTRVQQWYEYKDRRLYPEEGMDQSASSALRWSALAQRYNHGYFVGYFKPEEIAAYRDFGVNQSVSDVAADSGAKDSTVRTHYLHDTSLKLGISTGSRLTTLQTWLELACLDLLAPYPPPCPRIIFPKQQ